VKQEDYIREEDSGTGCQVLKCGFRPDHVHREPLTRTSANPFFFISDVRVIWKKIFMIMKATPLIHEVGNCSMFQIYSDIQASRPFQELVIPIELQKFQPFNT
jgi:hypothetical protein